MTNTQKMIGYAQQHEHDGLTDEEFCGQMIKTGIVIARTPSSQTIARATRIGKTIIVAETTVTETTQIVDGKVKFGKTETTAEIMRLEL